MPPPPPVPRSLPVQSQEVMTTSTRPFSVEKSDNEVRFKFSQDGSSRHTNIPLKTVVRSWISSMGASTMFSASRVYHVLNKLRHLALILDEYNHGVDTGDESLYFIKYVRYNALQLFSTFGFSVSKQGEAVTVDGLHELIRETEEIFASDIAAAKELVAQGSVTFDALPELYLPGSVLAGTTSVAGATCGFKVSQTYFEERRKLFGFEKSFHMRLEFVASVGEEFAVIEFEEVMSGWMGARTRQIAELPYRPLDVSMRQELLERGAKYAKFARGVQFLAHGPDTFFLHGTTSNGVSTAGARLPTSGRMVVDCARGTVMGHHASQGSDESTLALMQMAGRYKRLQVDQRGNSGKQSNDTMILFKELPAELQVLTWPALVGFSFSSKGWGHVLVDGLHNINFNDNAFDQLVIDPKRKQLIRALVRFGSTAFDDIIAGKSGGSIFLLHGPPGVGKTLTAEAIAEVLHKPLYYVTMGELGVTPEGMERRLGEVLTLCAGWDALTLIDEADVFLEKRTTSDVLRNAMVCVMLRLLEYHQGILFLTTNRVTEFDPAFESRVTIALKYEELAADARSKVWETLISRMPIEAERLDYQALGRHIMNGRQIKNAVRLALALAQETQKPLSQALIEETIGITALGRADMASAKKY
ncbi:P-loop containing nucleoside triphosphate hydrolase protein [Gaertneriomyces semiglobifer]|nr:P-loop containing nucleoside triphosphate hydrolase protein [Gaertneriomyces semiglobifer]